MTDDEQLDDDALMTAALTQPARFRHVFERHYQSVHAYLARRYGSDAADDLAGEVFAVAFQQRARFRPVDGSARPWLFGIAANVARRAARQEGTGRRAWARRMAGEPQSAPDTFDHVERADRQRRIDEQVPELVRQLRAGDRDVILLRYWEELSYEEIAIALDIPLGTVRSRIARAQRLLRPLLEREDLTAALPRTEHTT